MEGKQKSDRKTEKMDHGGKSLDRKVVQSQLSLHSVPVSVKNSTISERRPSKQQRTSSSDTEPLLACVDISQELKLIQTSLAEIRESMVKNTDIKSIVTTIVSEMKNEIKREVITEIKESLTKELQESVTAQVKEEFENKIEEKTKEFKTQTKDIADGFNLDFESLREKFHDQLRDLRSLKENVKKYQSTADKALSLANHNQQYSQKNNIKFIGWKENAKENLREDLCAILKTAGVTTDPTDILAIHRIPAGSKDGKPRPVIAKFKDTDTKIKIIRNRSKEIVKKHFIMYDHITPMNAQLLRDLNSDQRIDSAWYYNGKIFATDRQGIRHKFDILDNVEKKLGRI